MKRYDVVLGRSGGRPHARCDETPEGAYVRHYVAQKVIDALKAENERLKAAQEWHPISDLDKSMCCEWLLSDDEGTVFTGHWSDYFDCWVIYDGQQDHPMYRFEPTKFREQTK